MTDREERERAIERVLAGLREVEAPEGMERRVLLRTQERAEERLGRRLGPGAGWRWSTGAGVLAVLLVLAGLGGLRWREQRGVFVVGRGAVPTRRDEVGAASVAAGANGVAESVGVPRVASTAGKQDGAGGRLASPLSGKVVGGPGPMADLEDEARREERVAMEEMLAPSLVAAPLPLTREERLLQRAAQRGGAEEMALLREEERDREGAASRAEFREFFGPARSEVSELNGETQGEGHATN